MPDKVLDSRAPVIRKQKPGGREGREGRAGGVSMRATGDRVRQRLMDVRVTPEEHKRRVGLSVRGMRRRRRTKSLHCSETTPIALTLLLSLLLFPHRFSGAAAAAA